MMHTFEYKADDNRKVVILHNGDMSGDAILKVVQDNPKQSWETKLPCAALVAFSRAATLHEITTLMEQLEG